MSTKWKQVMIWKIIYISVCAIINELQYVFLNSLGLINIADKDINNNCSFILIYSLILFHQAQYFLIKWRKLKKILPEFTQSFSF